LTDDTATRPLVLAVIAGTLTAGVEPGHFATALAQRITRETGLRAGAAPRLTSDPTPGCDVLVLDAVHPSAAAGADFVLLLSGHANAASESAWRDTLIDGGMAWARVDTAGGSGDDLRGGAGSSESLDAALDAALDATAPLLRRRARPDTGLFTRLARRNAEHAGWRWVCDSCDVPECEHALRVASRMDSRAAVR
jgi:hypothetical protein